jgi:hypothetical protein
MHTLHPELMSSLAAERRRDMNADFSAHRPEAHRSARHGAVARWRAPRLTVPGLRVTWSRTTLAAAGRRRGRSYVIVISATRTR